MTDTYEGRRCPHGKYADHWCEQCEELERAAEAKLIADQIEAADKETLWWALYKLLDAIGSARAVDPNVSGADRRGGLFNIVYFTADHWGPQIPGMPDQEKIRREVAEDISHHERTFAAERLGLRVTGDEFI